MGHLRHLQHIRHLPHIASATPGSLATSKKAATDGVVPTSTSASIDAAGTTLTINFSEPVKLVAVADYALSNSYVLSAPTLTNSGFSWTMTIGTAVATGATVTLAYTAGGTLDLAGNALATFSGHAITNNSTVDPTFTDLMAAAATNLELWLRLDESSGTNANDSSSNNRDGTYTNTPTLGAAGLTKGDAATSTHFSRASNSYVVVPNFTTGYTDYTLLMKIRAFSAIDQRLMSQRIFPTGTWFDIWLLSTGDLIVFDGTTQQTLGSAVVSTGTNYIIFVRVSGTTMTAYINGTAQTPITITANTSSNPLYISYLGAGTDNGFDGHMQDVAVWSRALTTDEIDDLTTASAKTQVTITGVTQPAAGRALFATSVAIYNSFGDETTYAPFEIDAGGSGYISPTVVQAPLEFEYAVDPASTNAWRILTDMATGTLSFAADETQHYLKVPSSGTVT